MQKSIDRILVTHVGSLPRGEELGTLLIEDEAGRSVDKPKIMKAIEQRVAHVLNKQHEAGVDIASDGEQGRVGFQTYVPQRMSGFGGASKRPYGREFIEFPLFTKKMLSRIPKTGKVFDAPEAIGELHYHDRTSIQTELSRFQQLAAAVKPPFAECFFAEPSPGIIATTMLNAYYPSHEAYLDAIAREMRHEYNAVIAAGFILQIDSPDLAMERVLLYQDKSDAQFVRIIEQHVAALNKALADIPRDRVRLHVCWGNWEGPHLYDIGLEPLLPGFQANVGGLSIEFANARRHTRLPRCAGTNCLITWSYCLGSSTRKSTWLSIPRSWRNALRPRWRRSATASASLLVPIAALVHSQGGNESPRPFTEIRLAPRTSANGRLGFVPRVP